VKNEWGFFYFLKAVFANVFYIALKKIFAQIYTYSSFSFKLFSKKGKFMRFTKVLLLLLVLTAFGINTNAQDTKVLPPVLNDVSPSSLTGNSTFSKQVVQANNLDAVGDLLRNHNVDSVTPETQFPTV
jgi:hypothetical protein